MQIMFAGYEGAQVVLRQAQHLALISGHQHCDSTSDAGKLNHCIMYRGMAQIDCLALTLGCKGVMRVAPDGCKGLVTGEAQGLAGRSGVGQPPPAYPLLGSCPYICKLALHKQFQLTHFLPIRLQAQCCCCPVCHLQVF